VTENLETYQKLEKKGAKMVMGELRSRMQEWAELDECRGLPIYHVWVEVGDMVYDVSNGNKVIAPRELFYLAKRVVRAEEVQVVKKVRIVRLTKNSGMKIQDARDALGIVHKMTEEMTEHIEFLSQIRITPSHFEGILNQIVPLPLISKLGDSPAKNALTRAENKRDVITGLYKNDPRVAPWQHTGLGVVQAFNTYAHHFGGTDKNRIERNIMNILTGASEKADKQVLTLIGA
jgi:hypothetical protein